MGAQTLHDLVELRESADGLAIEHVQPVAATHTRAGRRRTLDEIRDRDAPLRLFDLDAQEG